MPQSFSVPKVPPPRFLRERANFPGSKLNHVNRGILFQVLLENLELPTRKKSCASVFFKELSLLFPWVSRGWEVLG